MIGPIITFVGVCAIVAIYMSIVHSFLRKSEGTDVVQEEKIAREVKPRAEPSPQPSRAEQWAH